MEDYNYEYDDYGQEDPAPKKTIRGYQIIIIALAVILAGLSFIYFKQMSNLKEDFALERETLTGQYAELMGDYDNLRTTNDTINIQLMEQRHRADSIMESLANERRLSMNKIRQYEKELGTLRTVMREYVHTIDSLNTLNKTLISENTDMRRQVTTERMRAEKAEETATELTTKVRRAEVLHARGISLKPLSNNDREVNRANRAARLRTDFTLAANELTQPGERAVYIRIIGPDGYLLANNGGRTFDFEGEARVYSAVREVDYQNHDLPIGIYYEGSGITAGSYKVEVYVDGYQIGSTEVNLR